MFHALIVFVVLIMAVTGRVTTKVDIFSLGVILMELITGRKALDETQPEDSVHLVTWFRRVAASKEKDENAFKNAIDQTSNSTRTPYPALKKFGSLLVIAVHVSLTKDLTCLTSLTFFLRSQSNGSPLRLILMTYTV